MSNLVSVKQGVHNQRLSIGRGVDGYITNVVFSFEPAAGWTGSLQPIRKMVGSNTYFSASVQATDVEGTQTGSITQAGIYVLDATGCDVALDYFSATGAPAKVFYTVITGV